MKLTDNANVREKMSIKYIRLCRFVNITFVL